MKSSLQLSCVVKRESNLLSAVILQGHQRSPAYNVGSFFFQIELCVLRGFVSQRSGAGGWVVVGGERLQSPVGISCVALVIHWLKTCQSKRC